MVASGATSRLREWSSTHSWLDRAHEYDYYVDSIKREHNEEAIIEMSTRHANYSLQIQEKAIEALKLVKPENIKPLDLIRWLDVAVKIERLSRGLPTENIKQEQAAIDEKLEEQRKLNISDDARKKIGDMLAIAISDAREHGSDKISDRARKRIDDIAAD